MGKEKLMQPNSLPTIKFWGVRGSHPTPGAGTVGYGGNTPCVEVNIAGQTIILDAGTGLIPLGRDLLRRQGGVRQSLNLVLLLSHLHHDHTQGLPFFVPAFLYSTRLHIFGPQTIVHSLDQVLSQNMLPPVFPISLQDMASHKTISSLKEGQLIRLSGGGNPPQVLSPEDVQPEELRQSVCIRVLKSSAHPGGVLVYRIEWRDYAIVYATDTEGYASTDRRLADFARGADLLIHDAQYTEEHYLGLAPGTRSTQGWGHSTFGMACDVARTAAVRSLALFHFDPSYSDQTVDQIEAGARQLFPAVLAAREGLELTLEPAKAASGLHLKVAPQAQASAS
jgi:phosphoribosyl 1,2-cyclic phosphodiesterase